MSTDLTLITPQDWERHYALSAESEQNLRTMGTISAVFDRVCGHVVADAELAKRLINFQIRFVNKNDEHVAFFGGVLTGVQVVRFTTTDMNNFFSDVVFINESELEDELHALPAIVSTRKISGDVFNNTCIWLVSLFLRSKLPQALKQRAAQAAGLILNYRYLTSLLAWYYKFPADPEVAQAAYARLTKKSSIKQFGSWHALLENRVDDLITPTGLHYKTLAEFQNDHKIVYAMNDSQGRIREMMKILMRELIEASEAGARVKNVSATVEMDGEGFLRDKTKSLGTYTVYLQNILADEHSFIKQEILAVLSDIMFTTSPQQIMEVLKWCSANSRTSKSKEIEELINMVIVHSFNYLSDNRSIMRETNDLAGLIVILKGVYTSSRSTDPYLFKMRALAEKITRYAVHSKNASVIASVKTSLMLYLVMRAFTMNHYGTR